MKKTIYILIALCAAVQASAYVNTAAATAGATAAATHNMRNQHLNCCHTYIPDDIVSVDTILQCHKCSQDFEFKIFYSKTLDEWYIKSYSRHEPVLERLSVPLEYLCCSNCRNKESLTVLLAMLGAIAAIVICGVIISIKS